MYNINNSILEKDGEKVYAIGQSYYPSFHEEKYPVPPHGDRIGEMKKDLKEMAEMGFNHVRFATIPAEHATCMIIHVAFYLIWVFGISRKILDFAAQKYAKSVIGAIDKL